MGQAIAGMTDFTSLLDLASERLEGKVIIASDEFFARAKNLVKAAPPILIPGKFTSQGKWMDGWESRRKREPGHDWCILRLGVSGTIHGVNVDTAHFNGNQPQECSVEAAAIDGPIDAAGLSGAAWRGVRVAWTEIVARTPLKPSSEHLIAAKPATIGTRFTHVRLNIYPDGGVARLRVYGEARQNWAAFSKYRAILELSAAKHGGLVIAANDMHFGSRHNLIMPGRPTNMGDGWETRRKRNLTWEAGRPIEHDWAVVQLAHRGGISRIEVDTGFFKGNYPESCMIEICDAPERPGTAFDPAREQWNTILARTRLRPNTVHSFTTQLRSNMRNTPCTHARLTIYPDGGIARLRLWGRPIYPST